MTPDQRKLVEDLFDQLIQLPPAQRDEELGRHGGVDEDARRELSRLLARADGDAVTAAEEPSLFKNARAAAAAVLVNQATDDSLVGASIGAYFILEKLNEGGFGTVYKAEQRQPVRRIVALKVIKLGFDTKEVIARFNSERQALARMDHPNISKVLDAGSTNLGRPYFVMEYVAGRAITRFCDENRLSIKARLLLFLQVCDAVTHAHQKAIIHRDIKAGNVLAFMEGGKVYAKVIDFGIAKALTRDGLTDLTLNTAQGTAIGTYESMSPEQAAGSPDIDTRTDVYSLGVLLYHLLVGASPFDRRVLSAATDESLRRMIREVEPPSPSERLRGLGEDALRLAVLRGCDPETLRRQLQRELEWIPLKAMRKERDRRYSSAQSLAEDIQNYLQGRALIAGPESRLYRFKKSLRRNAGLVAAVGIIAFVLLLGIVGTTIQSIRARAAERTARDSETRALILADEKRQLAAEKTAALESANHQLGIAFLESARRLGAHGDNFPAAMAAATAVGFDGDHSGAPALRSNPLLQRDTPAWREAMGLCVARGDVRLIWRSPATVHHGGPVRCVAFSPDDKTLASCSDDETLRLWDLQTGKLLQIFDGHAGEIVSICFGPDGKTLASDSGASGRTVRMWDITTGSPGLNLTGHEAPIRSVCYSPVGDMLASASHDGSIRLWKAGSGQLIRSFMGNSGEANSIAFSPDGSALASSSADGTIIIWDVAGNTDEPRHTLKGSHGIARGVSFSADAKLLASASPDHTVCLWDLANPQLPPRTLEGHSAEVTSVCFSADGTTLASGSLDSTVRLWDLGTGRPLETLAGNSGEVYSVRFSGDGKRLAWGSRGCRVHLWELGAGKPPQRPEQAGEVVTSLSFSPDSTTLASASRDNTICLWDAATGERKQILRNDADRASSRSRPVVRVVFNPGGTTLASINSSSRAITLWDLATLKPTRVFEVETSSDTEASISFSPDGKLLAIGEGNAVRVWDVAADKPRPPLSGLPGSVTSVSFSPDGKRLAAGSNDNDGTICIWDLATDKVHTLKGHTRGITCVRFSPDGATLASGATDKTVRLWDVSSGSSRPALEGHTHFVTAVSFSPDGKTLASSSSDTTIRLWDVATGRSLLVLPPTPERVSAIGFSPDGHMLASAAWDGTVSMYRITPDKPRRPPLKGHTQWVSSNQFSSDGSTLASGSFDKTVRLWDARTGEPRPPLEHPDQVFCVAFQPTGNVLASGSQDRTVRLWDVSSGKQIGSALSGARGAIVSLAFSPDGKTVAAGSRDRNIHLWDAATGDRFDPLVGHPDGVFALAYSPDGKVLASGSRDPTIRLWDPATRRERVLPAVHTDRVAGLCFSPDSSTLASASYDHTVCLWDIKTGEPRWRESIVADKESRNWLTSVTFHPHGRILALGGDEGVRILDAITGRQLQALRASDASIFAVCFSPDGKTLACASNDTNIYLWDVGPTVPLRQYLQVYRFDGMQLVPLPAVNLYDDDGFRAQTLDLLRPLDK